MNIFILPCSRQTEHEIAIGHWPFSDQFSLFGRVNPICWAKFAVYFQWTSHILAFKEWLTNFKFLFQALGKPLNVLSYSIA